MRRPHGIKGRKRKKPEASYDRNEEESVQAVKTAKHEQPVEEEDVERMNAIDELPGIPIAPIDKTQKNDNGVIFILEKASLEVAKVGKNYQILSNEDHANFLKKNKKNPADYRPDIVFQALLSIMDSTLNKAGKVKAIYVRTEKGVLFEIKPYVRIPRTYKRFAGIMLQLLQKLSISAVGKREKLLRVIKNPVTQYLPVNSRKIGFSHSSEKLVEMSNYVDTVADDINLVFVVGAMSHGKIDNDYTDDYVSVSEYPLSAAYAIWKICGAMERKWNIH